MKIATLLSIAVRVAVLAGCLVGIFWSYRIIQADHYFHEGTPESIREAIRIHPDVPDYYVKLALLDPDHAGAMLRKALAVNPYDALAATHLALLRESEGDYASAERLLLDAFKFDRAYLSRWSLANFYFRRDNMPQFWYWARKAAEMPAEDLRPLFQLCWRAETDAKTIQDKIVTGDPSVVRQYMQFLMEKNQLDAASDLLPRLVRAGTRDEDRPVAFQLLNRLAAANNGAAAGAVWESLRKEGWVKTDSHLPNNSDFARDPLPVALDWSFPASDGVHAVTGPAGLEVEFSGSEPESCVIAEQMIPAGPGEYEFSYRYRTSNIEPNTGLSWQVLDAGPGIALAASPDLSSAQARRESFRFPGPDSGFIRLRLQYHRALGTPRISGNLVIISTSLQFHPGHELSQVRERRGQALPSSQNP